MVNKTSYCTDCDKLIWEGGMRCKSCAHKGLKHNDETKKKLSEMRKGERNPFYGRNHNPKLIERYKKWRGPNHPSWKGGRHSWNSRGGYIFIWTPEGYKREHRIIMESILGRDLKSTELIHHQDENPSNNNELNLKLLQSQKEHSKYHNWGKKK